MRIYAAQDQIRIGHYRLLATLAITCGARIRADGTIQSLDRRLAAEMEVSVMVSEPAAK